MLLDNGFCAVWARFMYKTVIALLAGYVNCAANMGLLSNSIVNDE